MATELTQLATGNFTDTDAAAITVPAGQAWEVRYIHIQQPVGAVAKVAQVGLGTTGTAVNVKVSRSLAAGQYHEPVFAPIALAAAATLNVKQSVAANTELTYLIEGYKRIL
jgi:hypothetical protein